MEHHVTEQDYELLSQYLDGELSAAATSQLQQRLATERGLQGLLERLQASDASLKSAFERPALSAVPPHIVDLVQPPASPVIIPLPHRRTAQWGFALAASLAVAVCGTLLSQWGGNGAQMTVDASLAQALEHTPSSGTAWQALPDGRQVRSVLSFQSHSGDWCREYIVASEQGNQHGVACRTAGDWSNTALAAVATVMDAGDYRPAGAANPDEIADFINAQAADIPLSAEQETQLIDRNWQ